MYLDNIVGTTVPEPATMVLFGVGLLGLAGVSRKKIYMENESDNIANKELKTYNCPHCGRIICKGLILRFALTCPNCNKFVRIVEEFQE